MHEDRQEHDTDPRTQLLDGLTNEQRDVVQSASRRVLVVAGAGSGKTEVMSRRVVWWTAVEGVERGEIAAFTFTEAAAEEMKFRIRRQLQGVLPESTDVTLGEMSVGTIHGFCLAQLRQHAADQYYNYDVIDDVTRIGLMTRGFSSFLGLGGLKAKLDATQGETLEVFTRSYDILNEYGLLDVELASGTPPVDLLEEREWIRQARLRTDVGSSEIAQAFAVCAARYYAYLRARRFLDFSTAQAECVRLLEQSETFRDTVRARYRRIMVDEVQDINPIQLRLIQTLVGDGGHLTAVGDHRQSIYGFRGSRVDLMIGIARDLRASADGEVLLLSRNFRSTPRIIDLANEWARTITHAPALPNEAMLPGNELRVDREPTGCAAHRFAERSEEAEWIASAIGQLIDPAQGQSAVHSERSGDRGISYGDVAVLVRSSTSAREYMLALEARGIPSVFRAGPDLFSRPEVLLMLAALAFAGDVQRFLGGRRSICERIRTTFGGIEPTPAQVIESAYPLLDSVGMPVAPDAADRLILACRLMRNRFSDRQAATRGEVAMLRSTALKQYLTRRHVSVRIFPQHVYHMLLEEAGVPDWDCEAAGPRGRSAMWHLGALSGLIKGLETPGWTRADEFKWQVLALCNWGATRARTEEAPLLVEPDAVTIRTIHGAKGLEWPVVFLADINPSRFPSNMARRQPRLAFDWTATGEINPAYLADNPAFDAERRLMYVGITRAKSHLFMTASGLRRQSRFWRELVPLQETAGFAQPGPVDVAAVPQVTLTAPIAAEHSHRLVTSFSDMRYYQECPHDFFLRKVLGFAPTIDQAFGYGRAVHNLMRAIHSNPGRWAGMSQSELRAAAEHLVNSGLFYLRYTAGPPAENMRDRAARIVEDYVSIYRDELATLTFEPERTFETLLDEEDVLVGGAIDLIRHDDPPRVTIVDFKSGTRGHDVEDDTVDESAVRRQISLYGLAARTELEYEPELGLVRYLGESRPNLRELSVPLDQVSLQRTRTEILETVASIKARNFESGPAASCRDRCRTCDFKLICGKSEATTVRNA